jgi:hypothetical protein
VLSNAVTVQACVSNFHISKGAAGSKALSYLFRASAAGTFI